MTNDQLLAELKKRNLIDDTELAKLKRDALLSNKPVEALLHDREEVIPDEIVAQVKSGLLKIPYYKLDIANYDNSLLGMISEETVRSYGVLPISKKNDLLVVGMVYPDDLKAQDALKFIARQSQLNLGVYVVSYGDWEKILQKYSPYKSQIAQAVKSLNLKSAEQKLVELENAAGVSADDAPIIRIVADTLKEAIQANASDVHIEPQQTYLRIRFRVNGDLHEAVSLPLELSQLVVSRVKVMSQLRIDETRVPQDGRFRSRLFDREIDFRVATFPTPSGEKVAIRVLDPKTGLRKLDQMRFGEHNFEMLSAALEKPFGMILISGPTGSGKSTTLYGILQKLNDESVNIVSLEDPVEYFVSGINQSQVHPEIGYDFASGLRQILRQDPDVVFVGEIRDNETAGLAIHAALTGHVVLSTLHTNNAVGVIPRLIDMKVEPFLLPSALNLMMSQRLISTLCEACRKPEEASPQLQEIIKDTLANLPKEMTSKYEKPYQIYKAPGCPACKMKGISGRMPVYEMFCMTPEIEAIVAANGTSQEIFKMARKQGLVTLREDGVLKALEGLMPIEEVIRETAE
ncbi:MAG: GspE/PulE family protein [bacterium]|nr:GspE/PulE family protein [bacterium]